VTLRSKYLREQGVRICRASPPGGGALQRQGVPVPLLLTRHNVRPATQSRETRRYLGLLDALLPRFSLSDQLIACNGHPPRLILDAWSARESVASRRICRSGFRFYDTRFSRTSTTPSRAAPVFLTYVLPRQSGARQHDAAPSRRSTASVVRSRSRARCDLFVNPHRRTTACGFSRGSPTFSSARCDRTFPILVVRRAQLADRLNCPSRQSDFRPVHAPTTPLT